MLNNWKGRKKHLRQIKSKIKKKLTDSIHKATGFGKAKRIIIAGGGTGGHIFPAISIANAIKKIEPGVEILFVGAKGKMEMEKVPQAGYEIKGLDIAGFNRSSLFKNISLPFKLLKSFFQVRSIFDSFKPDAVIGVGGYSSFPVLKLAQAKGIPSFIHESNAFAGRSNIMLGRRATQIFVAAEGMNKFFPASKIEITGNPVRVAISDANTIDKKTARAFFNLHPEKITVLAVGGSLGARSINEAVAKGLETLEMNSCQLIWQTGRNDLDKWKKITEGKKGIFISDFISRMEMAYAAADVVVSRAGAMAVAELCMVKKPVVFVPYPHAAEDHQTMNAKNLVEKNAAVMVKDSEANEKLLGEVITLVKDEERRQVLTDNIGKQSVENAAEKIAEKILKQIGE
jgi:UDP-N-acetylglucosamine--N-acetylmuramyl-(pentapeptide) pyrophosphoryl-undecaprenol N-acetylglucosamine transferase